MELITLSCGIGRSYEEAVNALFEAKGNKGKEKYNIIIYDGPRLRSKLHEGIKEKANKYLDLAKIMTPEQRKLLDQITLYDPVTGLLNKVGFAIKLSEFQSKGIKEGYYIFLDIDDLHAWNIKLGYTKVDLYLESIGKTIHTSLRYHNLYPLAEGIPDLAGHRLNESAGDEFLIFVPGNHNLENNDEIKKIAERILEKIYENQKGISKEIAISSRQKSRKGNI